MSFFGNSFIFNSIPCEAYDLMMYDLGNNTQSGGAFASNVSIQDEVVGKRYAPYFYGVQRGNKLSFGIVFGVNQRRIDKQEYLDRYELSEISSWLTGHEKYLWLEIQQEDMEYFKYKCIITGLEIVSYGNIPWALKATVTCDSAYAYTDEIAVSYTINGQNSVIFHNQSALNGYFYPIIDISMTSGSSVTIENLTDNGRKSIFTNIPSSVHTIHMDNDHCVLTNDQDLNLYPNFNRVFFRTLRGQNQIKITGNCTVTIRSSFPVDVGG